ncbi:hypothetical protein Tsubulata_035909 [Turnera subulata]|uniref:Uncharacterized protein n=1 Tax=Turnera subulata TaxID=218843 RepID=A0A9Q0JGK6_9ROSI|nr:hypothetical protein Tsubulata_035909 [Turnera subulata]
MKFRGKEKEVIYEGLSTLCYICGRVDHTINKCPLHPQPTVRSDPDPPSPTEVDKGKNKVGEQATNSGANRSRASPWMNAPMRACRNTQRKQPIPNAHPVTPNAPATGSRYEILAKDLDKNGGLEDSVEEGIGQWITVA